MEAGVQDREGKPALGSQEVRDTAQGGSQVRDIHQGHRADDAIEGFKQRTVETLDIGVDVFNPLLGRIFMTTRDCQEVCREIDANHTGASGR
jgi:hypothetical protein